MSAETLCMATLNIRTSQTCQVIDITAQVAETLDKLEVSEGLCQVYVAHTTAAVTINENEDPNIGGDLLEALNRLVPAGIWQHDKVDDNGAAHIKASLIGPSETLPVRDGKLLLGTYQAIMLVEFDGPRTRQLYVTVR